MKFCVKNKLLSLGGSSTVKDENGNDIFKVKGKIFSLTKKKKFYNMEGKLLYVVKNKLINWWTHSSFIKDPEGQIVGKVKNRGLKFGYDVVGCSDEISINGWSLTGCQIMKNGEKIGSVTTQFFAMSDTFNVELNDNEDPAFITALIIAMDNVRDRAART